MVHIYNGILLSHRKEWNWVICRDVDGSRDLYTESQYRELSQKKKNKYMLMHTCGIRKNWYRWSYL